MGVKYIYADAWSAPGFMKTNNNYVGCYPSKMYKKSLIRSRSTADIFVV